jgi:thioester reductase-like protein
LRDGTEVSDGSDPAADAVLDASISIAGCAAPSRGEPESILLTGATGFLGIFLLRELLGRTTATIYCLIRAADDVAALARIDAAERKYRVDLDAYRSRIVAVTGDLARPLLGLEPAQFADLAERIDVIYHNGAQVNHLEPYARLRAANVGGTTEVLRLASTTRVKPVHYSSTMSVLKGTPREDGVPDGMEGYALSKWVAEQLVWAGIGRDIPVTIYRVGLITGDSRTGAAPVEDAATTMLRAMLVLGVWPAFRDIDQPMAPVDYVAAELVRFSRDPNPQSSLRYLAGSSDGVWSAFAEEARRRGYPMAVAEPKHFVRAVADAAENAIATGDDALARAAALIINLAGDSSESDPADEQVVLTDEQVAETGSQVAQTGSEVTRTGSEVELTGSEVVELTGSEIELTLPAVDATILARYFDYFIEIGFFPAPMGEQLSEVEATS